MTGCLPATPTGNPLCWDAKAKALAPASPPPDRAAFKGRFTLPKTDREAVPAFELLARRYLDDRYAPDAVADETGVPATTIRRLAAEIAHAAFEEEVVTIEQPWTDWAGRRHEQMIGRPVALPRHARHLGPFQRLPHLPSAASAAGPAG